MRKNSRPSYESFMITNGSKGQVFFSPQLDVDLSSLATKLGRKIKTEIHFAFKVSNKRIGNKLSVPEVFHLTKVTLL